MLDLLAEHLSSPVLTYLVDGGVPELIHRLLPLMTRARHRLHLIYPSHKVDVKSLDDEVAEVHRGWTDGVMDAGEIACRVLVRFVGFLVYVLCHLIRITLTKVLFADDVVFV